MERGQRKRLGPRLKETSLGTRLWLCVKFPAPSSAEKHCQAVQYKHQVLCHRPPNYSGLHVSLQAKAFGEFMDVANYTTPLLISAY